MCTKAVRCLYYWRNSRELPAARAQSVFIFTQPINDQEAVSCTCLSVRLSVSHCSFDVQILCSNSALSFSQKSVAALQSPGMKCTVQHRLNTAQRAPCEWWNCPRQHPFNWWDFCKVGGQVIIPYKTHRRDELYSELECGPMPNVMAALPNIGGALCSTLQSLADLHTILKCRAVTIPI